MQLWFIIVQTGMDSDAYKMIGPFTHEHYARSEAMRLGTAYQIVMIPGALF